MAAFMQVMLVLFLATASVQAAYPSQAAQADKPWNFIDMLATPNAFQQQSNEVIVDASPVERATDEPPVDFSQDPITNTFTAEPSIVATIFGCPDGWESQFGKCYLPTPKKITYPECLSTCANLGATLPCVTNAAESLYLVGLYPSDLEFCAFIGLNDIVTEGKFEWQTGCVSTFTYFMPHEPNNYHDEDCVTVCLRGDKMWNDLPCRFETYCVCEKSEGTATQSTAAEVPIAFVVPSTMSEPESTTPAALTDCPVGWESQFGKCYLTTLPKQNYTSCLSTCTNLGATLPCVMNAAESLYLASLSPPNDMLFCAFLGLSDIATEGQFEWPEGCASTFTYYLPGEPNNYNNGEDCVSVCFGGRTMWNDMPCGAQTHCVCEKNGGTSAAVLSPHMAVLETTPAVAATHEVACPKGWVNNFGKCYLTTLPKQDYISCVSTCTTLGATPPCVMNAAENKYLAGIFGNEISDGLYLGLNDIVTEGTHQWQTGCASNYRNFLPGEPNNWQDAEDCTALHKDGREMWNDVRCNMVVDCVCERSPLAEDSSWYSASAYKYDQDTRGGHAASALTPAPVPTLEPTADSAEMNVHPVDPVCPIGWVVNAGKCYFSNYFSNYFSTSPTAMTYDHCQSDCANRGATLPCVMNAQEHAFLGDLPIPHGSSVLWGIYLGLNDIVTEGEFKWQEGCSSTFTSFPPNEPNDYQPLGGEDCVALRNDRGSVKWNDIPCTSRVICVCEKHAVVPHQVVAPHMAVLETTPVVAAALEVTCPKGWVKNLGKCYLTTLPKQDYISCVSTCTSLSATPPCVMNSDESLYLAKLYNDPYSPGPYVGLNDIVTEGSFQWQEGCASQYISFLPNEPNDFGGQEDCVVVYMDGRTLWNDVPCTTAAYCVCEKSAELQCSCADCAHFLSNSPTREDYACSSSYCYHNC